MTRSEAQKRADAKYRKDKVEQATVKFYPSEMDLYDHLVRQGKLTSKAGYIKDLIRKDMESLGPGLHLAPKD